MKILAIETSCDETSCAIVEDGRKVLANVIASQVDIHAKTGGVVPEVAAREHVLKIIPVLDECLQIVNCGWDDIDALAVTKGPGLISSLIIGTQTANVISYLREKPMIPVQHIVGHLYSNWLEVEDEIEFPVLVLTVSGGHNELILMKGHNDFEVLGETRDDAAGEAFDKVARIMGLGYPGGPAISREAEGANKSRFALPRIMLGKDSLDFSFSGLKTAVLNEVKDRGDLLEETLRADLAASFQEAVVEVLAEKLKRALAQADNVKEVHMAGGVSANKRLRELISEVMPPNVKLRWPKQLSYCTDNAAMIAGAAYFLHCESPEKYKSHSNIIPDSSFEIW